MRKNDPINNIMSNSVQSVQQGQPLSDVYKIMCNAGIHHVPVVDGKTLVGLISFTDMMKLNLSIDGVDARGVAAIIDQQFDVPGIMSTDLVTLVDNQSVRDAAALLGEGDFHSLPVVNGDNTLVGMVTSTDLIRYLSDQY